MVKYLCIWLATILFWYHPALAFNAKVVAVTDGDTIKVLQNKKQIKIRLYGIDCPEKGQAYGKAAKKHTAKMVAGKSVKVTPRVPGGEFRGSGDSILNSASCNN